MKKSSILICVIIVTLLLFFCGCSEEKKQSKNSYTWTAKQVFEDIPLDLDWEDDYQLLYNTLEDGDKLIIQDTISDIIYDSDFDITKIIFEWTDEGETNSYYVDFEGNLTDIYQKGVKVKITGVIKYVEFNYENLKFEIEIFEKQWINQDNFITNGLKPLPSTSIKEV